MLIHCITFVKFHLITCITLNYCLIRNFAINSIQTAQTRNEIHNKMTCFHKLFPTQFPFVQLPCKDCYLTKEHADWTVKLVSKGFDYYINKVKQLTVTGNTRRT